MVTTNIAIILLIVQCAVSINNGHVSKRELAAREADNFQPDLNQLFVDDEGFRNLTFQGVPQHRVIGIISAATLGFKILGGIASQVNLSRVCVVGLANKGNKIFEYPEWYLHNGILRQPLPRELPAGESGIFTFEKTHYALAGTSGVFTYNIKGTNYKIAVMWSVPELYGPYSNRFNVMITTNGTANKDLFNSMYDDESALEVWDGGHWLTRHVDGIQIHGSMTNSGKASLLVEVIYNDGLHPVG